MSEQRQENPLVNLYSEIAKILNYIVIKNSREADKYETKESARDGSLYTMAVLQQDNYLLYTEYFTDQMFIDVNPILRRSLISHWKEEPYNIPVSYRDYLCEQGRKAFLESFVERNQYYRMLAGLPPIDTPSSEFIMVPEIIRSSVYLNRVVEDLPIHEMDDSDQELITLTDWFTSILEEHPDKEYLRFLGKQKIELLIARKARDFQLIRYVPAESQVGINPYLIKDFAAIYNSYRDYLVFTLYNREFEDLFPGYRPFMATLLTMMVINQLCNRAVEHSNDYRFLDDKIIAIIFQMYGIPRNLIVTMNTDTQRKFITSIMKLIRKKATNVVFYDLIDILGFTDVSIYKLMLMKEQYFDSNGQAYFSDGTPISSADDLDKLYEIDETTQLPVKELGLSDILPPDDWERDRNPDYSAEAAKQAADAGLPYNVPEYLEDRTPYRGLPHFRFVDLLDKNPYKTIVDGNASRMDYFDATSGDPRWWDLKETRDIIRNRNYTNADSKYIAMESILRDSDYLYEVVYFMRMIIDNKKYTDQIMISIPELFGSTKMSLFDLMVFILAAMCINNGLDGYIMTSASGLLAVAGFNFELNLEDFKTFLEKTEYVDKDKVIGFLENVNPKADPTVYKFIFEQVMIPFKDWLTLMMSTSPDREEYLEYEKVFRACYSYDIAQMVFISDFQSPIHRIGLEFGMTDVEVDALTLFWPHLPDGSAITISNFSGSEYDPFIGAGGLMKTWYVQTDRGNLYFFDILYSSDMRYLPGTTTPNPAIWDPILQSFDPNSIELAIEKIKQLPPGALANAFFRVDTPIPNTSTFWPGIQYNSFGEVIQRTMLPESVRADGIYREVLIRKIEMDVSGESIAPLTYMEYIRRKNKTLAALFDIATTSKEDWINNMMIIVSAIESELNMHLKVWEQATVGTDMYYKSLISLIKFFKSYMIDFTRSGVKYIFDSKIDPGGGSNMLKLFDEIHHIIYYILIKDEFGLFDTEGLTSMYWIINDRATIIDPTDTGDLRNVVKREAWHGSLRMVDDVKFYLNGKEEDPGEDKSFSFWNSGEDNVGRFDLPPDRTIATYNINQKITEPYVDNEGWKEFVESQVFDDNVYG